jgi:hypothetical protein
MRRFVLAAGAAALSLAACGKAGESDAHAETQTAPVTVTAAEAPSPVNAADKAAILTANHLEANPLGLVRNECGDMVTPQFIPADVGLGNTILFVMVGGPDGGYTCYGDGPDLHLMRKEGAAWREIYGNRGGFMVILPSTHGGAHDLAFGGPGMTHARYQWNGRVYDQNGEIPDEGIANATTLPN